MTQKTDKNDDLATKVAAAEAQADMGDIDKMLEEIADLKDQLATAEDAKLRAMADMQNIRKRAQDERLHLPQSGKIVIVETLLPTFDHLHLALKNAPQELDEWGKGVKVILDAMIGSLQSIGLQTLGQVGQQADINTCEIIATVDGVAANEISEVAQLGYKLGDKVIRVAKVVVGK